MPACLPEIRKMKKEKWLSAFKQSFNRAAACEAIGIARSTLWRWLKNDRSFAEKVMEIEESLIDEIEGKLLDLARSGNLQAIKTFLKAKAANRGYTNKVEITQNTRLEAVKTERLEVLLSNPKTSAALEVIAFNLLERDLNEGYTEPKK